MVNPESMAAAVDMLMREPCVISRQLPVLVINTHADWDHVWGNGLFVGPLTRFPAPIIGHRLAAERMTDPEATDFLASFKAENPGRFDSVQLWPPTIRFEGRLSIEGGDLTLDLIPTPGHTPDHVSIWIPEIRLMLAADAAEMPFPEVTRWELLPQLRESLRRLDQLAPATALYCHAAGNTDPTLIRHNIAYFDQLEERCRVRLHDAPAELTGDPAAWLGWPLEEALPPGVSLQDLSSVDFYLAGHVKAIQAMVRWMREEKLRRDWRTGPSGRLIP
jgi:glyoxylase-like metal-dependent hydrolase (beta-lactamase superfamily II)